MKDERVNKKVKEEIEQKVKYDKNRDYLQQIHKKLRHDKLIKIKGNNNVSYSDIKIKNMGIPSWDNRHTKITLDVLKDMHYSDFNIDDEDDFRPTDVLDDDEIAKLNNPQKRFRKKSSKDKISVTQSMTDQEAKIRVANRRGVQVNQSQLSEGKRKSSLNIPQYKHLPANRAYDYAVNVSGKGDIKSVKKNRVDLTRDERSVPKMAKSLDINAYNAGVPRTKQAIVKNRLNLVGSQKNLNNKSMHYRRPTQENYPMRIHDSYAGVSKLPYMKQQMNNRVKQIESTNRAKELRHMDNAMKIHDRHIQKGLKTLEKTRYQ